jgi:hypothetical protein
MLGHVALPFDGLSPPWLTWFTIAFVVICGMLAWTAALFIRALAGAVGAYKSTGVS